MVGRLRRTTAAVGLLALFLVTGCLGAGNATARLYQVNRRVENKWAREGVFLVLIPGYLVCSLGDNLIFNPIQWWTGEHPIDPPSEKTTPNDFGF